MQSPTNFEAGAPPASLIGQRIVIHAAARVIDRDAAVVLWTALMDREDSDEMRLEAAQTCLHPELALPILERAFWDGLEPLPLSAGLGTAIVGEPRLGTHIAEEFGVPRANDSDRDEHANWGWPMLDIEPWPEPIPMRGAQRFWNWPEPDQVIGAAQ